MSSPQSNTVFAAFSLDSADLSKSAINTVRTTLGITGAVSLIVGILITFWPKDSVVVITVILGIYFIIAGLAYAGLGIFSKGISGGARTLDIILGILFVVGGVIVLANPSARHRSSACSSASSSASCGSSRASWRSCSRVTRPSKGWAIFFGILSVVAGIVLLFSPLWGAVDPVHHRGHQPDRARDHPDRARLHVRSRREEHARHRVAPRHPTTKAGPERAALRDRPSS